MINHVMNVGIPFGKKCGIILKRYRGFIAMLLITAFGVELSAEVEVQLIGSGGAGINEWYDNTLFDYSEEAFAFSRIPRAYTDKGVIDEWPNPLLVVAKAEVDLPDGRHRILLRSLRAARLWMDGKLIAETPIPPDMINAHNPVVRPYIPLGRGVRFPAPGDQETLVEIDSVGGRHSFRLEFYVGGFFGREPMRPEIGETLVAVSMDGSQEFNILGSESRIPLSDKGWEQFYSRQQERLDISDRDRRHALQAGQQDYWDKRHEWAQSSVESSEKIPFSSIDEFIEHRISTVNKSIDYSSEAANFLEHVRPILEDRCWSCHSGKKVKGELRLDSRETAMLGGDSGISALVPGDPGDSYLLELVLEDFEEDRMPPKGDPLKKEETEILRNWIASGAVWPKTTVTSEIKPTELTVDWKFLRRVYLDTVGIVPSEKEIKAFLADNDPNKREKVIERLLEDPRWADHWVSYWQDVLAENPTIVNPTLNNTGPFRFWIHEALQDNLPMDWFVTELVLMEGSRYGGGPAGFEMASENDVPMAAKANILSTAFMGMEMKCSRCHDAPFHDNTQLDLFSMAALLAREPLTVPASSSVPLDKLHTGGRKLLIEVTLKPGTEVEPKWPMESILSAGEFKQWLRDPKNTREQLALQLTSPHNERFAKVVVNRLWSRLFGQGIVEPVHDWENANPLYPELLEYLADELVRDGYDLKAVARLILNTNAYQRAISEDATAIDYFAAQGPRQMSAEQIVDNLFATTGKKLETEPLVSDLAGQRRWLNGFHLGQPERAWMFGGMANNRDRPSLILPRAQAVVDVLNTFGWRASRQEPISYRQRPLTPLQPAILNNGIMSSWLTRFSDDHELTGVALEADSCESLVDTVFLRILNRYPDTVERKAAVGLLKPGFEKRKVPEEEWASPEESPLEPEFYVTWGNSMKSKATTVALEAAEKAKKGDPPTSKLESGWRERMEDLVWSLINLSETIYYP